MTDGTHIATEARAALARRARMPWWLLGLQGLALLGLLVTPVVAGLVPWPGTYAAILWPSVIVLVLGETVLQRSRGVLLSRRTLRDYPSTRLLSVAVVVLALAGVVATNVLANVGRIPLALTVAVLVAAAGTVLSWRLGIAVQRDIRDGRAAS